MRFMFFFLLLGFFYLSWAQGTYEDCCLRYVKELRPHQKKFVSSYRRQDLDGGCNLPAIVFKMMRGRIFCGNPKEKWVQVLMEKIKHMQNESVHKNKQNNKKHSRG
ncbi:C-C motif chemokine 25 [Hoplias malabaricus]|uniref:C-C motif chemokine 25 n=1 Tax=Hoplias malabaricus TaxID=27720 RepID=UPI003462A4F4